MTESPAAATVIAAPALPDRPPTDGAVLSHLALLRVAGPDAGVFLDSQLTRNVPGHGVASPAGYCSPKGRLLATFVAWSTADAVWLVVSHDIATAIARRLRMYVLRAKVTIDDVAGHVLDGVAGDEAPDGERLSPWQVATGKETTHVRLPDADGQPRLLRVRGVGGPPADGGPGIEAATWRWMDIRAGLPWVTAATQDRFVPQMLNLEAIGGVDFKKGCFPGQEVVARSQYLGKLKRRTALCGLAAGHDVPMPGSDVWQADGSEAVGVVVTAERGPDGAVALLAELPIALFGAGDLHVGAHDGPALVVAPLPYALPDNEVFVRPRL